MRKPFAQFCFCFLLLILPFAGFSQKLEKPVIDRFSNDTTKRTTMERIGAVESFSSTEASYVSAGATKINSTILLDIELDATTSNNYYFTISQGNSLLLKFANGNVMTLTSIRDAHTYRDNIKHGFIEREYFIANTTYDITSQQIDAIMASALVTVRVTTDSGHFDFDIKPKGSDVLKKVFKLVR